MSAFRVSIVARNPKDEERATPPVQAVVDTGSELTWLPADLLTAAGITPRRKRTFATLEREVGYAIVSAEGFGVLVDNIGHRFVARTTLVAATPASAPFSGSSGSRAGGPFSSPRSVAG